MQTPPDTQTWLRERGLYLLSILFFLIAAVFSIGAHHPDEHFQLLEFSNYKRGLIPADELPWEFAAQMRPTLLVGAVYGLTHGLEAIGIRNPFMIATIMRLLAGMFTWIVFYKVSNLLLSDFKTTYNQRVFIILVFLTWFVPYVSVRFSSENIAASLFLLSLYLILLSQSVQEHRKWIYFAGSGLLLGLSFHSRYQMALAMIGLGAWLLFVYRARFWPIFALAGGFMVVLLAGVWVDAWFYGEWTCAPCNYVTANLVEGKAAQFGVHPWWQYPVDFLLLGILPLSLLMFIFFIIGLKNNLKSVFTWTFIPFFVIHSFISHKELRFMFPIVFTFLYFAALGFQATMNNINYSKYKRLMVIIFFVINIPFIMYRSFIPANEAILYYKFLYEKNYTVYTIGERLYSMGTLTSFYRPASAHDTVFADPAALQQHLLSTRPDSVYLLERTLASADRYPGYDKISVYCMVPAWFSNINVNNWQRRSRIWHIYLLKKQRQAAPESHAHRLPGYRATAPNTYFPALSTCMSSS